MQISLAHDNSIKRKILVLLYEEVQKDERAAWLLSRRSATVATFHHGFMAGKTGLLTFKTHLALTTSDWMLVWVRRLSPAISQDALPRHSSANHLPTLVLAVIDLVSEYFA